MPVRVAIVGVGNCANSFMQGIFHYGRMNTEEATLGLVRPKIGAYRVADIEIVAAFDVVEGKVGVDVAQAIWAFPNATFRFAEVPEVGVIVQRGPTLDGRGKYLANWGKESAERVLSLEEVLDLLAHHCI